MNQSSDSVSLTTTVIKRTDRWENIDLLKGIAVILMVLYHLLYDLSWFAFLPTALPHQWPWKAMPYVIITTFYFSSGVNTYLQVQSGKPLSFWKLIKKLLLPAIGISVVTFYLFPSVWIFFGTLHCLFFSQLVLYFFIRLHVSFMLWPLGVLLFTLSLVFSQLPSNPSLLFYWSHAPFPQSMDWVSPIPWMAIPWFGYLSMTVLPQSSFLVKYLSRSSSYQSLRWLGRHSLSIYLLHQLVLFPAIGGLSLLH
jgi:uncharacterized membrane protein